MDICPEMHAIMKMANLTKFRQRSRLGQKRARDKGIDKATILTNQANSAIMTNLTKFRQRSRLDLERMSSRERYRQSSDFDESGEFGENDV